MDRATLHLAERLVIAMETMSQDVKNMSAYVYDISCRMSYLVNEKRQKENIPVVAHGEFENPPSAASAAGQEASDEGEYSAPYEQVDERSLWRNGDAEQGESSFIDIASTSIDPNENTVVLTSEGNQIIWNEVNAETQSLSDSNDEVCGMYTSTSNHPEELTTMELPSREVYQEIKRMEDSSNSAVSSDYDSHMDIIQEGQARTHEMENRVYTRLDSEKGPHKCSVCAKAFQFHSQLKIHNRVHSGEKPYKCNFCGKAFTQSGTLNLHMLSHTGKKPYRCDECGKEFREKATLGIHMRTHTGEKPYSCDVCRKTFSHSSNLKVHVRTHTGEEPYKCTLCGKAFRQRVNLTRHMRTHLADDPAGEIYTLTEQF